MNSCSERADANALRLLVVDDHAVVREGLKRILERSDARWIVSEAASGAQALQRLREAPFDLAIVDLSMPGISGLELMRRAHESQPRLPVLMLSMHAEDPYVLRALRCGASGYVTKDSAARELADAVRRVLAGGTYVGPAQAARLLHPAGGGVDSGSAPLARLSDREFEVLRRLVAGERPTDIARALALSVKTVSSHKAHILEKLQLPGLAALVRFGLEHGLASEDASALRGA